LAPAVRASASTGAVRRQHGHARAQLVHEAGEVADERSLLRQLGGDRVERGAAPLEIVSWRNGRATLASAVKVVSRLANRSACVCPTGRRQPGRAV